LAWHLCLVACCCALAGALTACPPAKADCSSHPGYEIVVTALEGPLPADLRLKLDYDSGCEIYDMASDRSVPCVAGEEVGVMFCSIEPVAAEAGVDASAATARLTCSLWGVGSGTVTPLTSKYPPVEVGLGKEATGCDPTSVPVVLAHDDAGP
jgi:hypothetical protein